MLGQSTKTINLRLVLNDIIVSLPSGDISFEVNVSSKSRLHLFHLRTPTMEKHIGVLFWDIPCISNSIYTPNHFISSFPGLDKATQHIQ